MKNVIFVIVAISLLAGCSTTAQHKDVVLRIDAHSGLLGSFGARIVRLETENAFVQAEVDRIFAQLEKQRIAKLPVWQRLLGEELAKDLHVESTYSDSLWDLYPEKKFDEVLMAAQNAANKNDNFEVTEVTKECRRIRVWLRQVAK